MADMKGYKNDPFFMVASCQCQLPVARPAGMKLLASDIIETWAALLVGLITCASVKKKNVTCVCEQRLDILRETQIFWTGFSERHVSKAGYVHRSTVSRIRILLRKELKRKYASARWNRTYQR
jgi:hypothetical protein